MDLIKSLLAGVLAAIFAVALWVLVTVLMSMNVGVGGGVIGFFVWDYELYLAALAGFGLGFFWLLRRLRRRAAPREPGKKSMDTARS